jgi:hypothetical protein
MRRLWLSDDPDPWHGALADYERVIERQGVVRLPDLERWYRIELPNAIARRVAPHILHAELVRVTEWKMARGISRGRNLALVKRNPPEAVVETSGRALSRAPDPTAPIAELARLSGVGPATASAVAAAAHPETYPFLDELVAAQVPGLERVAFTLGYYRRYAEALQARAGRLGPQWTPVQVEQALWASAGGKAGSGSG